MGANRLQNFPEINLAQINGGMVDIDGTLDSEPNTQFDLQFFAVLACDASDYGEGRDFLGSQLVMTNAMGDANFMVSLPATFPSNSLITATATYLPGRSTSEFSLCAVVMP